MVFQKEVVPDGFTQEIHLESSIPKKTDVNNHFQSNCILKREEELVWGIWFLSIKTKL